MADAAETARGPEADEPRLTIVEFDQAALVRTPAGQHFAPFVGSVEIPRAQYGLPALLHSALGQRDEIPAAALEQLGALRDRPALGNRAVVQQLRAVSAESVQDQRSGAVHAVHKVSLPVVVPKWARTLPICDRLYRHHLGPRPGGVPRRPAEDLQLSNIQLSCRGGGTAGDARRGVPEMVADYPEPMLFGALPAWGLYVRHAAELKVRDLALRLDQADARPAVHLDDVQASELVGIHLNPAAVPADWLLAGTSGVHLRDCDGFDAARVIPAAGQLPSGA